MDNVGIVVESLDAAVSLFAELGLELEGEPRSKATGHSFENPRIAGYQDVRPVA